MKITLERIDTRGLDVDLGGDRVALAETTALRGLLDTAADVTKLEDVAAERIVLAALRLAFGDLVLASRAGATLDGVAAAVQSGGEALTIDVAAASLAANDLTIAIDDVVIEGQPTLDEPRLTVRDGNGSLAASRLELPALKLSLGGIVIEATALSATGFLVAWGEPALRISASSIGAATLVVTMDGTRIAASQATALALSLDGDTIKVGQVGLGRAELALRFNERDPNAPGAAAAPVGDAPALPPFVDLSVLDRVSGRFDVDLAVDLAVPIIGRRKATHRFRIAIDGGTIDFIALEHNLSKLEDAIIDFATRDHALVIERVNPLMPFRGKGKPVVRWELDDAGVELAKNNRVRLRVLPNAKLETDGEPADAASKPSSADGAGSSSFALNELGMHGINAKLVIDAPPAPSDGAPAEDRGQLRIHHVGQLSLGGNVYYLPGEKARAGSALGEIADFAGSIVTLPLGDRTLDIGSIRLAAASPVELAFSDIDVRGADVVLDRLELADVTVQKRS